MADLHEWFRRKKKPAPRKPADPASWGDPKARRKKIEATRKRMEKAKKEKKGFWKEALSFLEDVRVSLEAQGAEQVACAASGALGLKKGQKGDKKKLAAEIAKRTKSKKLASRATKKAQEY